MAKNDLFKKDWIDIIFEGRNQKYGAYKLRLENPKTTVVAFFSGLFLFAGLFVVPTVLSNYFADDSGKIVRGNIIPNTIDKEIAMTKLDLEKEIEPIIEDKPIVEEDSAPLSVRDTYKFSKIEVVKGSEADDEIATQDMFIAADPGKADIKGNEEGSILITEEHGYKPGGEGTKIEEKYDEEKVFLFTSEAAEPMEGIAKFRSSFASKFRMIEITNVSKVQVILSFVVEKDGSLSSIKVLRDPGYGAGKEAIRVLKTMPNWKPAKQDKRNVRSQFTLPITIEVQ